MSKIAILGGSFNPFHIGHAAMAEAVLNENLADEVWLMPAKRPPHKPSNAYADDKDRVGMLKAYAEAREHIKVSEFELELPGMTYTAKTLEKLHELYPDDEFLFVLGGDSIQNFHKWYCPEKIVEYADLIVFSRDDTNRKDIIWITAKLKVTLGGNYIIPQFKEVDVSSTEIRDLIANGKDFSSLVPTEVFAYIKKHELYVKKEVNYDLEYYMEAVKKVLKPKRYTHSVGVMETAGELATIYGVDVNKAKIAGILHDNAKYLAADELINLCVQNNVPFTKEETKDDKTTNSMLHSKAGAILARNIYNIEDEDIINAIFYHTVGRPKMSRLEEIIFVADFIEPNRTQNSNPPLETLREIAKKDLDKAVFLVCESTIGYLSTSGQTINAATLETRDYYRKLTGEQL